MNIYAGLEIGNHIKSKLHYNDLNVLTKHVYYYIVRRWALTLQYGDICTIPVYVISIRMLSLERCVHKTSTKVPVITMKKIISHSKLTTDAVI